MVNSIKYILLKRHSSSSNRLLPSEQLQLQPSTLNMFELTKEETEAIIEQFSEMVATSEDDSNSDVSGDGAPLKEVHKTTTTALNDRHIDYFETSQMELQDLLDAGQRSVVYSCLLKRGSKTMDRQIAVKVTQYDGKRDSLHFKLARNEAMLMQQLSHSNIVYFFESNHIFAPNSSAPPLFSYYQLELMTGGSLENIFREGFFLTEAQAVRLLEQISSAVAYLHRHCIAHHDLTPANILLDRPAAKGGLNGCTYKLCDLNWAMQYPSTDSLEHLPLGDYRYFAPEKLNYHHQGYSPFRADIFSLGLVTIEALSNFCADHREVNMAAQFSKKLTMLNYRALIGKQMMKVLFAMTDQVPERRKLPKK